MTETLCGIILQLILIFVVNDRYHHFILNKLIKNKSLSIHLIRKLVDMKQINACIQNSSILIYAYATVSICPSDFISITCHLAQSSVSPLGRLVNCYAERFGYVILAWIKSLCAPYIVRSVRVHNNRGSKYQIKKLRKLS